MNFFHRCPTWVSCALFFLALTQNEVLAAVSRYDAAQGYWEFASFQSTHPGFDGNGYVDFQGQGGYVEWEVDAPTAGEYSMTVRYSSSNARPADLIVDDTKAAEYAFAGTSSWANWETESEVVTLSQGSHFVRVYASQSTGPNINWLEVTSPESSNNAESRKLVADTCLFQNEFISSPSGNYRFGLVSSGNLVLLDQSSNTLWSAGTVDGTKVCMQGDGNLVVRDNTNKARWASHTSVGSGESFLRISDLGIVTIVKGGNTVWLVDRSSPSDGNGAGDNGVDNGKKPDENRGYKPGNDHFADAVVLQPDDVLKPGDFKSAPAGNFWVGLTKSGDLVLHDNSKTIWSAGVSGGHRCYMQSDGNLIIRDVNKNVKWASNTSGNYGTRLTVDDAGRIALKHGDVPVWLDGIPRKDYVKPPTENDIDPSVVRGAFYYPWYPETWTVNGKQAKFEPSLGFYSSSDPIAVESHVDQLEYAYVDLSIASWWGPNTNQDKARLTLLMETTVAMESSVKWTVYHEDEREERPSPAKIKEDLDYLKKWFAWHPAWAHRNQKPVIFVYNEGGCDVADRWMAASNGEWYVVLKVFPKSDECKTQPDSWHQYGPATETILAEPYSFSISPGFWRADRATADLPRVSEAKFCQNVKSMVDSAMPWQLITTFNEAGEGTMLESSPHWRSESGYGYYLDCLHLYY